jgi:hypothetical protein
MLLLVLGLEHYASYSRALLLHIAVSLRIPISVLIADELRLARSLSMIVKGISVEEIIARRTEEVKNTKRSKGNTPAPGQLQNGQSGNLAPSLCNAGVGTVFGGLGMETSTAASLLGSMAESTVAVGTLFGLYGARQGGKTMDGYAKDVQDFAMVPVHGTPQGKTFDPRDVPAEDRRLRVVIGINGWLADQERAAEAWQILGSQNEVYGLRWETEVLTKMGMSLQIISRSAAWSMAKKEIKEFSGKTTILGFRP